MQNFTQLLTDLHAQLTKLKHCLNEDKDSFLDAVTGSSEQANIEKLEIKNSIDALLVSLHNHPQWPQLKQSSVGPGAIYNLWSAIQTELKAIQNLININRNVLTVNQEHCLRVFNCLVKAATEDSELVYTR